MAWWVEERPKAPVKSSPVLIWSEMNGRFWAFIAVLTLFMLGNSSDAFLMLRAQTVGFSTVEIFLVVARVQSCGRAYLDKRGNALRYFRQARVNNRGLADLRPHLFRFCLCVGPLAHMGSLCGVRPLLWSFFEASSALVADLVSEPLRGTAYGIFNAALRVAAFPASLLAGLLWDWYGPSAPFLFGVALAVLATIGLLMIPLRR